MRIAILSDVHGNLPAFDAVLTKPVDWDEVAHYLGGLIGHRRTGMGG